MPSRLSSTHSSDFRPRFASRRTTPRNLLGNWPYTRAFSGSDGRRTESGCGGRAKCGVRNDFCGRRPHLVCRRPHLYSARRTPHAALASGLASGSALTVAGFCLITRYSRRISSVRGPSQVNPSPPGDRAFKEQIQHDASPCFGPGGRPSRHKRPLITASEPAQSQAKAAAATPTPATTTNRSTPGSIRLPQPRLTLPNSHPSRSPNPTPTSKGDTGSSCGIFWCRPACRSSC